MFHVKPSGIYYSRCTPVPCYSPRWRYYLDPALCRSPWRHRKGKAKR